MWTVIGNFWTVVVYAVVFLLPLRSYGEETSFEATVNANKISLQDVLELSLTIHGSKEDVKDIPLPAIDGFDSRYVGPQTRFFVVNGVSSSEHSFVYNLFPLKTGHFQIPAVTLIVDGKTFTTKPIEIDVEERSTESKSPVDVALKQQESIEDKVFLKASLATPKVYVGQKTPLRMKVYVKDLSLQLAAAPSLKPDGFTADATCTMEKGRETLNGIAYDTLTFDTNIYPTHAGRIAVGPFQAVGQLIYRIKESNDFFQEFFGRAETRPITLNEKAVTLEVMDLPSQEVPADFTGAVGRYDFKAIVGPNVVKLGDPLTLRMTISGEGPIKTLTMPSLNDDRFKTYDPQIKDEDNSRNYEQVIIPTDPNVAEVPAVRFSYFDPQEQQYKTIVQGPFSIRVVAPSKSEEFKAYGFVDKTKADRPVTVKMDWVNQWFQYGKGLMNQTPTLVKDWRFWLIVILAGLAWLALKIWQVFQKRMQNDPAFARRLQASAKARKGIAEAEILLKESKKIEFYNIVNKTLRNFLADKLHQPVGSITLESIESRLTAAGVEVEIQKVLKDIFDRCDHVRFAGGSMDESAMKSDLQKVQELISYLDKKLK